MRPNVRWSAPAAVLILIVMLANRGGVSKAVTAAEPIATVSAPAPAPGYDLWFHVGESFRYRLQWGMLTVGEAWMTTAWVQEDGRSLLAIRGSASTGRIVEKIYPVENEVEALVDPETFLPLRYWQRVREGRRRRDETTSFFHDQGRAEYVSHRTGKTKTIAIDNDTRDLLTFFYYIRRQGLEVGESASFRVLVDDQVYDLSLLAEAREVIVLPNHGRVSSLRIEPQAKFGEVFVRRGRVWAWLSDDARRLCLRLTGKLTVANVHAVLTEVDGPGQDRWAGKPGAPRP